MKIIDVTLTLFTWDGIPAVSYGPGIRMQAASSTLGLLALVTDSGLTGHAFLGGANRGAELEGRGLIDALKPLLMGQDALERERLYQSLWRRGRLTMIRAIQISSPSMRASSREPLSPQLTGAGHISRTPA
jgi:L-alanine-DL-glutamate epimerase-like enolase superfamily enzyme